MLPTANLIALKLGVTRMQASDIRTAIEQAEAVFVEYRCMRIGFPAYRRACAAALQIAADAVGGIVRPAIRRDCRTSFTSVATYVSRTDTTLPTLIYIDRMRRWRLTPYLEWVEQQERRGYVFTVGSAELKARGGTAGVV